MQGAAGSIRGSRVEAQAGCEQGGVGGQSGQRTRAARSCQGRTGREAAVQAGFAAGQGSSGEGAKC